VAGYFGGWVESLVMRLVDVQLSLPGVLLAIAILAATGKGLLNVVLVLGFVSWVQYARIVRGSTLSVRAQDYVLGARAIGAGHARILRRHILPSTLSILIAEFVYLASRAILLETTLAFLGLGDPVQESWGSVLFYAQARGALLSGAWLWWVLPPGLLIAASVLGFALLGLALEPVVNPRLRSRPASSARRDPA
jgi:peptide/nickel transport system ATP-binding protein/peptide/nickel transport system permease protein